MADVFKIIHSTDPRVVGVKDGLQAYLADSNSPSGLAYDSAKCDAPPSRNTVFDCFQLDGKANLTDFISIGGNRCRSLLISSRVFEALASFKIAGHLVYPVEFNSRQATQKYFLIWIWKHALGDIDFGKTILQKTSGLFSREWLPTPCSNHSQAMELSKESAGRFLIQPRDRYFFMSDNIEHLDIFIIGGFDMQVYFRKAVVDRLLEIQASGIVFEPSNRF